MLIPTAKAKEFEKFGFKKCKGEYGKNGCYYLCVARGVKTLFVSNVYFGVFNWKDDDPRIHKDANCRYRDSRTYLDIIYELIKADMLRSDCVKEELIKAMNYDREQYANGFENGYNKAVDDFVELYKSKTTMENELVDKIAEQLKNGGSNAS